MLKYAKKVNWILLGLVMLIPGLLKLFVLKPAAIEEMLAGLGFPAAGVLAWVLIIAEIVSGVALLANWQVKHIVWIPVVILVVAAFTVYLGNYPNMLVHIALASNYLLYYKD